MRPTTVFALLGLIVSSLAVAIANPEVATALVERSPSNVEERTVAASGDAKKKKGKGKGKGDKGGKKDKKPQASQA